jgi:hypothetical protein
MSEFTYENEDIGFSLEKYEWDNVWWECANEKGATRVLYIGDSISCGIRRIATEVAENKIYFDGMGTSKAIDNPYLPDTIRLFAKQQGERVAILFSNGLHGWHIEDATDFKSHYEKVVKFLMEEYPETPLLLLLNTAIADQARDARCIVRNRAICEISKKYNLPVIDLYSISDAHRDLYADGVHLKAEGYKLLAEEIVDKVKKAII